MAGIGSHTRPHRGATDVWLTPKSVIRRLGLFNLDPCAPDPRPWDTAGTHYADGGLDKTWFGRVWLNPPYGPETGKWLAKLADHGDGIAIVFARTETQMFQRFAWDRADGMLFLEGRLHFHHGDGTRAKGNAGGPSVLRAYGKRNVEHLHCSKIAGVVIENWRRVAPIQQFAMPLLEVA